jgi:hypothetical protein
MFGLCCPTAELGSRPITTYNGSSKAYGGQRLVHGRLSSRMKT